MDELQVLKTPYEKITEFAGQFTFNFNRVTEDSDNSVYFTNKLGLYKITGNQTDVKFLRYIGNNFDIDFYGNDTLFNSPASPNRYKIVYTDLFEKGKPCGLKV